MRLLTPPAAATGRTAAVGPLLPGLLVAAVIIGTLVGLASPPAGAVLATGTDALVLLLVFLLLFDVGLSGIRRFRRHRRVIVVALLINFLLVPLLAVLIARLFGGDRPEVWLGLIIYLTAPCTDWFLGFTRLADGNVAAGSVLLPINLIAQLLLCPVYWAVLGAADLGYRPEAIAITVGQWFVAPLLAAVLARQLIRSLLPGAAVDVIIATARRLVPWTIAALIVTIFAGHADTLVAELPGLPRILGTVAAFFLIMLAIGELVRRAGRFDRPDQVLLTMTTSARNAPLMIAIAAVTFPDRPAVVATIVAGMLIEFPHLIMLTALLRRRPAAVR
ncbi:arsenic resistance protein [Microlunatus parietis]|uniref:ACR3 family arsenite efflux pump ArsB n=1 Tax=Microlunatus parietis TaxID=682979 RepID=A0A7Y9I378_9ACTN|nr:bile acid:sodium symporter [Microlunatus parietis]NYE69425.1 ACR3 family arsenite efflux pump ArsB [Microlunatus parietis]